MTDTYTDWRFHPRQTECLNAMDDPMVQEVLFGGAKGGGKSVCACRWAYLYCQWIIDMFDLQPTKYPVPVGFMGRKQSVDFTDTTFETWKAFIPDDNYTPRAQAKEIIIGNRVKICYGGFDRSEDVKKFNSAEYAFTIIDQAEEITRDDIALLRGSLRRSLPYTDNIAVYYHNILCTGKTWMNEEEQEAIREKITNKLPLPIPTKVLLTANPAQCWLRDEFITFPDQTGQKRFIQSLPSDNKFLPPGYIDKLKDAFRHRPELLQAYLYGSWDALEGADQVIKDVWIQNAYNRNLQGGIVRHIMSCDPARFGDDETVIYRLRNTDIIEEKIYGQKDLHFTANLIHKMMIEDFSWTMGNGDREHLGPAQAIVIDEIGLGGGLVDELMALSDGKYMVIAFNGAAKSRQPEDYYNQRAEMWNNVAQMFSDGDIDLSHEDQTLRSQLCTPKYSFKRGKLLIEGKEDIKKRLSGKSPDRADCYVQGVGHLSWVDPIDSRRKGLGARFNIDGYRRQPAGTAMSC